MVTITDDQESPSPSSQSLINVTVATYHGLILRKDRLRFYITYNNSNDLQEVELKISSCELLEKLENFTQGFRLCAGFEVFNGLEMSLSLHEVENVNICWNWRICFPSIK